jgi:membrane protease YdiL (CAAX protease family)
MNLQENFHGLTPVVSSQPTGRLQAGLAVLAYYDLPHNNFKFISYNLSDFLQLIVATFVLGYLRVKSNSIWPGVLCHNLIKVLLGLVFLR